MMIAYLVPPKAQQSRSLFRAHSHCMDQLRQCKIAPEYNLIDQAELRLLRAAVVVRDLMIIVIRIHNPLLSKGPSF